MKKIIIFSLLLLTVVIFRSPSLVNPVVDEDEAWYYSAAMIINSDGVLYKDAVDLKPPLIFYTFAMFMKMDDSMIFIHIITILWVFLTSLFIYFIMKREGLQKAGIMGAFLYALFSASFWPKSCATNCEILMNLPIVISLYYYTDFLKNNRLFNCFLSGIFLAIASLYKYQAAVIMPAFLITGIFQSYRSGNYKTLFFSGLSFISGFLFIIFITLLWFIHQGSLDDAYFWAWKYNFIFMKGFSWSYFWTSFKKAIPKFIGLWIVLWIGCFIYLYEKIKQKQISLNSIFYLCVLLFSISAVMVGGKFFSHYFVQLLVPLSLISGPVLYLKILDIFNSAYFSQNLKRFWICGFIILFVLAPVLSLYKSWRYELNTIRENKPVSELAKFIRENSGLGDRVFCWGRAPELFVFSKRLPASRFITSNFLVGMTTYNARGLVVTGATFEAWNYFKDHLFNDLKNNRPKFLVDTSSANWRNFGKYKVNLYSELDNYIKQNFEINDTISGFKIYIKQ